MFPAAVFPLASPSLGRGKTGECVFAHASCIPDDAEPVDALERLEPLQLLCALPRMFDDSMSIHVFGTRPAIIAEILLFFTNTRKKKSLGKTPPSYSYLS